MPTDTREKQRHAPFPSRTIPGREQVWGDAYGPYQFPDFATGHDSTTTIYFTMSTWNPYTVVLMKATLKQESE